MWNLQALSCSRFIDVAKPREARDLVAVTVRSAQENDAGDSVDDCSVSGELFVGNTQRLLDHNATQTMANDENRPVRTLMKRLQKEYRRAEAWCVRLTGFGASSGRVSLN